MFYYITLYKFWQGVVNERTHGKLNNQKQKKKALTCVKRYVTIMVKIGGNEMNLTSFRKDIYNVAKSVIENHEELEISVGNEGDGVVLMSLADYRALKELQYLENTGVLSTVLDRMENETEDDFSLEDAL